MATQLHPWLSTPEALQAAHKAVQIPLALMGAKASIVGADELLSEALAILTECAIQTVETAAVHCAKCQGPLGNVRAGAKFCSPQCRKAYGMRALRGKVEALPATTGAHVGSMWKWPAEERSKWAIREVGYCLNNHLRTRGYAVETPASHALVNMNLAAPEPDATPRERVEEYLESKGIKVEGFESFDVLCEAAMFARGLPERPWSTEEELKEVFAA